METATSADTGRLARAFHALADRKRLEIVRHLARGERCVCELTDVVHSKQPLLSFHLKILREAGLVRKRRRGTWMYYSLNYETLEDMKKVLDTAAEAREHLESCCCESLCCPTDPGSAEKTRN